MNKYFILGGKDEHEAIPTELMSWAQWFESANRHVATDVVGPTAGIRVSTVFLGLDHSFSGGPPLIFETMIFGGPNDGYQNRYSTWDEAVAGHKSAIELAQAFDCAPGIGESTMANNRMYLLHRPSGNHLYLGKRMGTSSIKPERNGWYDAPLQSDIEDFYAKSTDHFADHIDDFVLCMEDVTEALFAKECDWDVSDKDNPKLIIKEE